MDETRRAVAGSTVALALGFGGCLDVVTGEKPLTFSADRATASDAAVDETGYEEKAVTDVVVTEERYDREIEVTNWQAQYERTAEVPMLGEKEVGVFVGFATPKVEVAGEAFNPVDDMSNRELLERVQGKYENVEVGEKVDETTLTVLETETTVDRFAGTATFSGQDVDIYFHVTQVEDGDDFVIPLGAYPQRLDGEEERIFTMMEGLEH